MSNEPWNRGPADAEWYYPGNCSFLKFVDGQMYEAASKNTPWQPSVMTPFVATEGCSIQRR